MGAYVALIGCGTLLIISWWQASGDASSGPQLQWMAVAVAALIVMGTVGSTWFMAGRRAVGERRARLIDTLYANADDPAVSAAPAPVPTHRLVAGAGMTRYHRDDCPLVRGKKITAVSLATHERRRRVPCGVCRP